MALIVGIFYILVLSLVVVYAIGGMGLGIAIFVLLAYIVTSELLKARHEEVEAAEHPEHHHAAHGGRS